MSNPNESFELHQKIVKLVQDKNSSNLELGEYLLQMKETGAYKQMMGGEGSFTEYLGSPEFKLHANSLWRYMSIVKKYIREVGLTHEQLSGLDTAMLYYAAKVVTKENYEEWLGRVRELSRSDIIRLVKYGDADSMACGHGKFKILPEKYKCEDCGEVLTQKPQ